jgi:hypothetical protein
LFVIPLLPQDSAVAVLIHSDIPLGSISAAWNQDEELRTSILEKFVIEIGFCWPIQARDAIGPSAIGLVVIPLSVVHECGSSLFSSSS